jgi:hypothetical protein
MLCAIGGDFLPPSSASNAAENAEHTQSLFSVHFQAKP